MQLSSYVHTHTFNSKCHVKPKPPRPPIPEGWPRWADPWSTMALHQNFMQLLHSEQAHYNLLPPNPFAFNHRFGRLPSLLAQPHPGPALPPAGPLWPLCSHRPWATAASTPRWPRLPSLLLPFIHVWPLPPWTSPPRVLLSWLSVYRDFPLPDVSWKPPPSMGCSSPVHTCPSLLKSCELLPTEPHAQLPHFSSLWRYNPFLHILVPSPCLCPKVTLLQITT